MKFFKICLLLFIMFNFLNKSLANYEKKIYDFKIESISGGMLNFSDYKNKVILAVNVASKCGFTQQYEGLQKLWTKYKKDGLIIVAFPSNQFGGQEPGSSEEIKNFCETNFNIDFPITKKIDVKGDNADPIYKWAKENYGNSAIPKWNFYKILIDKNGKISKSYNSMTKPLSKKLINDIEEILY
jgi:glutathione peroxidase